MKKIIILGSNGMAGHMVSLYLLEKNKYEIYDLCHKQKMRRESTEIDITKIEEVTKLFDEIKPDVVINCIGILNEDCDKNVITSSYINGFFPRYLENYFKDSSCKVIHLSTDCVFDGKKGSYLEDDFKNATSLYGISKSLGEIDNEKDLTIRTSIIGPEIKDGKGLFHWFMNQDGAIDGYKNVFWNGVTTLELAKIIDYVIDNDMSGLYNIGANEKIDKYSLLLYIKEIFNKDNITIYEETKTKSDKSLKTKKTDFNYKIKSYKEMLVELKEWMVKHPKYYQKYFGIKDKVIIVWSKIKVNDLEDDKASEWIKERIKVFMNYTCKGFKNQTDQNFYYFIHYDEKASLYLKDELAKYPSLPDNIVFTDSYYRDIAKILPFYKTLYFVRIDSDDMYAKDFVEKLRKFNPKSETKALIAQKGYTYDVMNDKLARWYYKSPPFYTLIYDAFDFSNWYRHEIHGHSSAILLPHEIIDGDNFVVIVHGKNTVTVFNSSFRKQIIEGLEMTRIKNEYDLKPFSEL